MEENKYTDELKKILGIMSRDIIDDYPEKTISTDHFILASLQIKESNIYKYILNYIGVAVHVISDFHVNLLKERTKTNISKSILLREPNKQISFGEELSKYITGAEKEMEKLNDKKVGSEHVLLSILYDEDSSYSRLLSQFGVTYFTFMDVIDINKKAPKESKKNKVENDTYLDTISPKIKNNFINQYCVDLNNLAKKGKIDKLIGRSLEIDSITKIIGRRNKNNVILCGQSGVGKKSIVYGIAEKIVNNNLPFLASKIIVMLDYPSIISGANLRGMMEERLNGVFNELKNNKDYILFINDIHTIIGGNSNNSNDISGIMSNALIDGDLQIIATTSHKGYKTAIESNTSIEVKFQKINIEPTNLEETIQILENTKHYYESYHSVNYTSEAIKACVLLGNRYITERVLPDSAIDILDEAGSNKKIENICVVNNEDNIFLIELKKAYDKYEQDKDKLMKSNSFELADVANKKSKEVKLKIIDLQKNINAKIKKNVINITEDDIYNVVSKMTNIPLTKLTKDEKKKYLEIDKRLSSVIIGQDEAVKSVSEAVKRSKINIGRKNKPISVMMFIGPSAVGKTLLAKKLAEEVYGSDKDLIRFDMSEYSDKTSVSKLIGSSSGYVDSDKGGVLTEAIKKKKHCVLLLDEIEKADSEVYNLFLQVFDEGYLNDNFNNKIDFRNVIIIMTSNVGAKDAASFSRGCGFITNIEDNKKFITEKSLKSKFQPEFINRIDSIINFKELSDDNLKKIIELELNNLNKRLNEIEYSISFNDEVIDYIFTNITKEKTTGARKINRAIQREIEDKIVDLWLENEYEKKYTFNITIINNNLEVK